MIMKFTDWVNYKINPSDLWTCAVDPTGNDRDHTYIPLGLSSKPKDYALLTNHPHVNTKLLFYSFGLKSGMSRKIFKGNMINHYADSNHRQKFKNILDKTYSMTPLSLDNYFTDIGKYKFNISPEGNGIDCFRHYETWISKGIPIIEFNSFIAKKYYGLPILWTIDYSEINDNYLTNQYDIISNKTYDFRKLLLSSYNSNIQKQILTVSDFPTYTNTAFCGLKTWKYNDHFT